MSERKKRLKNHIKAAKEWLCKAEDSLDKDNNIQGDLNLMLAQAELQRAKESEQSKPKKKSRGFARLAPVAVAVLLVGIGSQLWPHIFATTVPAPVLKTVAEEPAKPSGPLPPVMSEINTGEVSTPAVARQQIAPAAVKADVPLADNEQPVVKLAPAEERETISAKAETPVKAQIPPADMQKLMRAAGKTLREQ